VDKHYDEVKDKFLGTDINSSDLVTNLRNGFRSAAGLINMTQTAKTMNQSGTDSGQSMEDILASIRRIIAEGEQDAKDGTPAAEAAKPAQPKAEIFELTQIVQDDGSVVTVGQETPKAAPAAGDKAEASVEAVKAEAAAVVEKLVAPEALAEKALVPAPSPPAPASDTKVESAMAALSRLMDIAKTPSLEASAAEPERRHSSLTVEELVRDALRPMLRQWLDANLPPLVERAVKEAVDKLAKRVG
jgi:cell pole-organizing protein PopZ